MIGGALQCGVAKRCFLNDDKAGKPEGIHLVIGRRPVAAFGNSIGDKQMLEHTERRDNINDLRHRSPVA